MIFLEREPTVAVSIIVPVYDTREYLSRCLDSVLRQTLQEIEVIAIDDASTDDSGEILRRYASEDRRIRIVRHQRNQGLHVARISGVLAASGEYIGYVDSDDYVEPDMFECMYRHAVGRQADVVRTGAWLHREGQAQPRPDDGAPSTLSFPDRTYPVGIEYLDSDFYPSMWLYLHHHRLWQLALPHLPRIRLVGEDNLTSFVLAFFAGRVISLPSLGYFYVERDRSLTGDRSFASIARHIEDRGTMVRLLKDFIDARGGQAEGCWNVLRSNNRALLFSYIDSLSSRPERMRALALFESTWGEQVPADRAAAWGAT